MAGLGGEPGAGNVWEKGRGERLWGRKKWGKQINPREYQVRKNNPPTKTVPEKPKNTSVPSSQTAHKGKVAKKPKRVRLPKKGPVKTFRQTIMTDPKGKKLGTEASDGHHRSKGKKITFESPFPLPLRLAIMMGSGTSRDKWVPSVGTWRKGENCRTEKKKHPFLKNSGGRVWDH